jgi:hypothetical protein
MLYLRLKLTLKLIGSHAQRFIVYGNSIAFIAWVDFVIAVDDIVFISDIDDRVGLLLMAAVKLKL